MGYRIDYARDSDRRENRMSRIKRLRVWIAAGFLCFTLSVKNNWEEGAEQMRDYLLPDRISKGQASVQCLLSDLREGICFRDALTAFCLDILDHESKT